MRWADFSPWPQLRAGSPVDRRSLPLLLWHGFVYAILAAATLSTAADAESVERAAAVLIPSGTLAAWYAYWLVFRVDAIGASRAASLAYFSLAGVLWALLLAVDPRFSMLSIVGFVQLYGYLSWRPALAGATVMTSIFMLSRGWRSGLASDAGLRWIGLSVMDVVWPAIVLMVSAPFFLFVRDVVRQSAERQRLIEEVQAARSELAVAERHAGMLKERERLAAELHDTLAQELSSIVMLLEAAQASVSDGSRAAAEQLGHALRAARESLREVRRVVWSLRPETLERGTLVGALDRLANEVSEHGPVSARVTVTGERVELGTEVQVTLLRVAQEALANTRRHAQARVATVTLSFMPDLVVLDVRDDGTGFDPTSLDGPPDVSGHFGLVAMRERVEALGGTLTIETAPGEGTAVVAGIPSQQPTHGQAGSRSSAA
jgi:signal transduction histidine kinase